MADQSTEEQLRAHIGRWRGTAKRKGPGFNAGPIDQLREEMAFTLRKIDEVRQVAEMATGGRRG
jgi:hypothetical protein